MKHLYVIVGWWVFSAAIQSMPEPLPLQRWYGFLYKFLHILGANLEQAGIGKEKK